MTKLEEIQKAWDEYCKMCDIEISENLALYVNPSEPSLIFTLERIGKCDHFLHLTLEEAKTLRDELTNLIGEV